MPDLFARVAPESDATRPATREEAVAYVARWGLPAAVEVLEAVQRRERLESGAMELVTILGMATDAPDLETLINDLRARRETVRANLET